MYRILICDDERDIVSALKIYLTGDGYETLEAYDGAQALEILAREDVQLVLMEHFQLEELTHVNYVQLDAVEIV